MSTITEHGYATYPRRFDAYRWYKPLVTGALFIVFFLLLALVVELATKAIYGAVPSQEGYDDMDFYTAAGAFYTTAQAVIPIPALLLAVLIVKDRPISSLFSSMGGWRWGVFLKTFAAGLVIVGVPTAVWCVMSGNAGVIRFTIGGFIILTLLGPLQGVAEELLFRGYIMQTVSSWFKLPILGIIVQIIIFAAVHPYNAIGVVNIAIAGLMYALVCLCTKGLEAGSSLHIINNMTTIYLAGFGFGSVASQQTVSELLVESLIKVAFFLFILIAARKLHWFDEVKYDDVAVFNARRRK